jgi:lipopolysaccharide transport system ATP-binding protein
VGTGFQPELTGRENVFLNGAILGMSRVEIRKKFDEIVAFAEVEKFLDTPVKRYSSGMYVRLAFAVAAHLEPEILIVDEVLAVGDAEFQKKCLGKMQDVSKGGRTVLFVSHNTEAIQRLTSLCLLLVAGRAVSFGPTSQVLNKYQHDQQNTNISDLNSFRTVATRDKVEIADVWFSDSSGKRKTSFLPKEKIHLQMTIHSKTSEAVPCEIAFAIETDSYVPVVASHYSDRNDPASIDQTCHLSVQIQPNYLRHGKYCISTGIYSRDFRIRHDEMLHVPAFEIDGFHPDVPKDGRWGVIYLPLEWNLESCEIEALK